MELLGSLYNYFGYANSVAVQGDYAYVTTYGNGLCVLDVTDPANPDWVGSVLTNGEPNGIAVSGNYAYIADGYAGLTIIDISNPVNPIEAGSYDTPGYANEVAVSGDYAYIADDEQGLRVIDIYDPSNPTEAGYYDTSEAKDVAVSGNYAYLAAGNWGLRVIDVSDPTNPDEVGNCDTPDWANGIDIQGNYAYIADDEAGLRIINITNPANPDEVGFNDALGPTHDVTLSGNYALVSVWDNINPWIVNISNPANPVPEGQIDTPGEGNAIAVDGDFAYIADGFCGFRIFNITGLPASFEVGFFDTEGCAVSVDVSEDYAYLASMDAGLKIVDISNPAAPEEIGSCLTPGVAWGAAVSDNYAYVAADVCGLRVIDVSNPANPFEAGSCLTTGYMICAVAVHQNLAFVLDQINSLLVIVDITYPAFPWVVSSLPVSFDFEGPGFIECIEVVEDYLYLAAGGEGLKIIDISIPSAPYEAGLYSIPDESVNGVAVSGNYAFIAGSDGLHIVYVENPSDPYEIGFCEISDGGLDVAIYDSYAYFAAFYSGLWVVDFSDPAAPFVNGHYDTPGISFSVDCDRNLAYLADLSHFEIFDCSEAVGGVPLITVTLTPEIFPYMPLEFNIEVTNNDPEAVNFDLWTMATLPDGSEYGPLLGPLNLTYPPGFSANRDRYQAIPAGAPAGTYTYDAYAGIYPAVIWSEDHFEFDVLPDSDGDSWSAAADWICTGELFPGETSVDITVPETYTLCPPYPNPFNAEMTVEFEVPRASEISLSIFDVQGRLVDVIASGQYSPGFHRAHWNGDGFASGVYFLRMEAGNFAACRKVMLIK